jgi:hypothetical protein
MELAFEALLPVSISSSTCFQEINLPLYDYFTSVANIPRNTPSRPEGAFVRAFFVVSIVADTVFIARCKLRNALDPRQRMR